MSKNGFALAATSAMACAFVSPAALIRIAFSRVCFYDWTPPTTSQWLKNSPKAIRALML